MTMRMQRIAAIAGRIIRQFLHDRRTLALLFVVPILVISLVGYLISEDKEPVVVGVAALDRGLPSLPGAAGLGGELVKELGRNRNLALKNYTSYARLEEAVRSGEVQGGLYLPPDLTAAVLGGGTSRLTVVVKGIDQTTDHLVGGAVAAALASVAEARGRLGGGPSPVSIRLKTLAVEKELDSMDHFAPAFIVGFVFFFTFLLTSVSFLRERSSGTMERLAASPITRMEIMAGYLLGFLIFALLQTGIILGYAVWVLKVTVTGSLALVMLILGLLVIGVVDLGIVLSFLARNELQVVQFIPVVVVPQIFLGGVIWPVVTLHPALRLLARVFPLTYAVDALRQVMLGRAGFSAIRGDVYVLLAFALAMMVVGAGVLRKQGG